MTTQLPQLKINGFRKITARRTKEEWSTLNIKGTPIRLILTEDNVWYIQANLYVIGWTKDTRKAFKFFNNCAIYTMDEMYELARGRKIK